MTQLIPWQRFWIPRGQALPLSDGYLEDPEDCSLEPLGLVSMEALLSKPCVALLGEPGIGKSKTLLQEKKAIQRHCERVGAQLLWRDLASFGDESRLVRALFENDVMAQWRQGSSPLYLVLDSFDECHLRIETLSKVLLEEFQQLPVERLRVFIACRPSYWPRSFEEGLLELWGEKGFTAVELAPLRKRDVEALARSMEVPPDTFLKEVSRQDATALAIHPVTLGFLLRAFRQGRLPADRWQLYLDGCTHLAQEVNTSREESGLRALLGPGARMAVASRVAALTLLSNRDVIWLGQPKEELLNGVRMDALAGEEEEEEGTGRRVPITEEAIRDTLNTGLFGAAGPQLVGWAHRTYAEFLTALFLKRRKVPREQLASLLQHPEDSGQLIVPQLAEVAGWLASQDEDFRDFLLETDPWVLLRSDAVTASPKLRERLIEALMGTLERGTALGGDWDTWRHYSKLSHPGLGEQLRRHLRDPRCTDRKLSLALRIARACRERSVAPDCADIALDPTRSLDDRDHALEALRPLADEATQARLLPLALSGSPDDTNGYLQQHALILLWPQHLSTEQVLDQVLAHARRNPDWLSISQDSFLRRIPPADLPLALRQIARPDNPNERKQFRSTFQAACEILLQRGWEHLEAPEVFDAFRAALWTQMKRGQEVFERDEAEGVRRNPWKRRSDEDRWRLIDALAASRAAPEELLLLKQVRPPLLLPQDFHPLLERAQRASSAGEQTRWADLANALFSLEDAAHKDAAVKASEQHAPIARVFSWRLKPFLAGDSSTEDFELEPSGFPVPEPEEPSEEQQFLHECEQWLQRIEAGDVQGWPQLVEVLVGLDRMPVFELFAEHQGWHTLPDETKDRISRAGAHFLAASPPTDEPWLVKGGRIPKKDWTGLAAFMVLANRAPEHLERLQVSVWCAWATLIITAPPWSSDEQHRLRRRLIQLATHHAPVDVMRALRRWLAPENLGPETHAVLNGLEGCWNEVLLRVALDALKRPALPAQVFLHLLWGLLPQGVPEAQALAESLLTSRRDIPQTIRVELARIMLQRAPEKTWGSIWPLLQADVGYGKAVLEHLAQHGGQEAIIAGVFTPEQAVDLYIWIERHGGARARRLPENMWRDEHKDVHSLQAAIWTMFSMADSREACTALERLNRELPGQDLLHVVLIRAQERFRSQTWRPPGPAELLALVGSPQARFVENAEQLLDVVLESLRRLQAELHGETPPLQFLWNEWKEGEELRLRPKQENDLSDWIKRHLTQDLSGRRIVVNREVEIRPTESLRPGQRTDLLVQATASGPTGQGAPVSVIIEVKGCWNGELWTAMREQLVERYLQENACRHGIYLVGWYDCAYWRKSHPHPTERRVSTPDRAQQILDEQARALSQRDLQVRAFVLDAAFRAERAAAPARRRGS